MRTKTTHPQAHCRWGHAAKDSRNQGNHKNSIPGMQGLLSIITAALDSALAAQEHSEPLNQILPRTYNSAFMPALSRQCENINAPTMKKDTQQGATHLPRVMDRSCRFIVQQLWDLDDHAYIHRASNHGYTHGFGFRAYVVTCPETCKKDVLICRLW